MSLLDFDENNNYIVTNAVSQWLIIHNQLKELGKTVTELRKQKAKIETTIQNFMVDQEIDNLILNNNSQLSLVKQSKVTSLTKGYIEEVLTTHCSNQGGLYTTLLENLLNRPKHEVKTLTFTSSSLPASSQSKSKK